MPHKSNYNLINIIEQLFSGDEFKDVFDDSMSLNDKIQHLTSESMLALLLVTTIEDELDIEFEDDEIDLEFFTDIEVIRDKVKNHLV